MKIVSTSSRHRSHLLHLWQAAVWYDRDSSNRLRALNIRIHFSRVKMNRRVKCIGIGHFVPKLSPKHIDIQTNTQQAACITRITMRSVTSSNRLVVYHQSNWWYKLVVPQSRAFAVAAPFTWNGLPNGVVSADSPLTFRRLLKRFFISTVLSRHYLLKLLSILNRWSLQWPNHLGPRVHYKNLLID